MTDTMRYLLRHILLVWAMMQIIGVAHAQSYFNSSDTPDPTKFLAQPSADENNPFWARDIYRHFQFKAYRDSAFYSDIYNANFDYKLNETYLQAYYALYHVKFFQPAFDLVVNKNTNKDIFYFLDSCRKSCNQMIALIPDTWQRLRPCVRLREANFCMYRNANDYSKDYTFAPRLSFPSREGAGGWLTGLLMSTLNPWSADTIMSRAYRHGWCRQVSGGMWASDVDMSRQLGTVAFAHLMSLPRFRNRLRTMQLKTAGLLYASNLIPPRFAPGPGPSIDERLADDSLMTRLANAIPLIEDETDGGFQTDLSHYIAMKSLRDSIDINQLLVSSVDDIDNSTTAFVNLIGVGINPITTPSMYKLVSSVEMCCDKLCQMVQAGAVKRRRPYELFGDEAITLEDLDVLSQRSSYPSFHASSGLATALMLMMIVPEQCDTLLKVGYQYGANRTLAGTSWLSDLEAGRLIGCMAVGVVASGSDFLDLLEAAQIEYHDRHDVVITDNPDIHADPGKEHTRLFTIDGKPATSHSRGILVGKGRKVLVP